MMKGNVKAFQQSTLTLTINNLDPTKTYDFIAYTNVNNAGRPRQPDPNGLLTLPTYYVHGRQLF
jgi:hypothetical protein